LYREGENPLYGCGIGVGKKWLLEIRFCLVLNGRTMVIRGAGLG
jgi:hypothetical protein